MPDVVSHLQQAGYTDEEITAWSSDKRNQLKAAGFSDDEVDGYFGMPKTPKDVPAPFVDRILAGIDLSKKVTALPKAITDIPHEMLKTSIEGVQSVIADLVPKSLGGGREPGTESELESFKKTGAGLLDLAALPLAPLQGALRSLIGHPLVATDEALRRGATWIYGEERVAEAQTKAGVPPGPMTYEQAKGNVDAALMAIGMRPMQRIGLGPTGKPEVAPVGGLPRGQDFMDAGKVIGNSDTTPLMERKLSTIYEKEGIHPAEVAHDAQSDPTIAQSILSSEKTDFPPTYGPQRQPEGGPLVHTMDDAIPLNRILDSGPERIIRAAVRVVDDVYTGNVHIDAVELAAHKLGKTVDEITELVEGRDDGAGFLTSKGRYVDRAQALKIAESQDQVKFGHTPADPNDFVAEDIRHDTERPQDALGNRTWLDDIQDTLKGAPAAGGDGKPPPPLGPKGPVAAAAPGGKPPSYTDAENKILSKISISERAPTERMTLDRLYTNFLDKLFPISKAVKRAGLADLAAEDNPYNLARLLSGHVGKADHFLNRGTFDFNTYENNGASLKEILKPVKDDLNGFRAYAAAARALELEGRKVKHGFDVEAAATVVKDGAEKFDKPFRELVEFQNRVTQYLRDSGVLSDVGYEAMLQANQMYVPFSRVMGIDEAAQARGGSTLQATNPIRKIKGSARDIIDPIESVVRNTYHFVEMAEKNQVGTKLVDMLKRASEELPEAPAVAKVVETKDTPRSDAISKALADSGVEKPDELASALAHATEPRREGEIAILRDGKRETYAVDPDLARAMKGLDAQSMGMLEKVAAFPASILRAGAVLTPDFAIRHTIRDFLYATTTFKGGVFHPIDMAKGFTGLIMKDEDYWNWLKGGGGNVSFIGVDRRYMQQDLRKLTADTGLVGRAWNVLADPEASMWDKAGAVGKLPFDAISKFVLDPLRTMTQFAESASHLAAFKKTMRAAERAEPEATDLRGQIIRAAWESRDTAVDAARMGASMRAYNMITAFANIKLQDTDRVVRAIKDNPIGTIAKIGGAITVPSVLLWMANHNDPRYAEIPQWQKDLFFIVMTPDHIFRIPKPWSMGMIFGTLPERLLDAFVDQKPDAFKRYAESLWQTSGPDFLPTVGAPIWDHFANRSTFTNRTLIPHEQEKFLPEYQYTPYTTELTKSLGKIIGAFPGISQAKLDPSAFLGGPARALSSPILMENYLRGWTGTLGMYALQATDAALRKTGALPDPPMPASTLADIPVVKAFTVRYPSASAESIQSFYDSYEQNKKYFDTWMAKAKDGDFAAVKHIQEMGGTMMFAQLDGIKSVLTEHSQIIRDIFKNATIPADEKRQIIDQLYYSMIQVSRHGNDAIREMRRQSEAMAGVPEPVGRPPAGKVPPEAPRQGSGAAAVPESLRPSGGNGLLVEH